MFFEASTSLPIEAIVQVRIFRNYQWKKFPNTYVHLEQYRQLGINLNVGDGLQTALQVYVQKNGSSVPRGGGAETRRLYQHRGADESTPTPQPVCSLAPWVRAPLYALCISVLDLDISMPVAVGITNSKRKVSRCQGDGIVSRDEYNLPLVPLLGG
jgi:hypothetical protein